MNLEQLSFITYCVGNLADALKMAPGKVYRLLRSSGVLNDYIIPGYDILHTFSKDYITNDLIDCLKDKGALQ